MIFNVLEYYTRFLFIYASSREFLPDLDLRDKAVVQYLRRKNTPYATSKWRVKRAQDLILRIDSPLYRETCGNNRC